MEQPPDTPSRSSALEAQVATLYELLVATTEAAGSLSSDLGALVHETDDGSFNDLLVQLMDVRPHVVALALQLRKRWPEATLSSSE